MKQYVTIGVAVIVGAALIEVALVPGLLIGGAAMLAPNILPGLRRRNRKSVATARQNSARSASLLNQLPVKLPLTLLPKLALGRTVAKTITFRVIVTSLDFTTNYLVIGELATAAGLSSFNLVAGPLFYLAHEAAWNYFRSSDTPVALRALAPPAEDAQSADGSVTISRALAKTITYRTIATVVDFTTNYVVVRNITEATILSASGFILGPFVYFGHEKAWDYFTSRAERAIDLLPPSETRLLPAPA
ncbi:DUF2061 domain-containing protein [Bradyrhizobium viridifuturi]|jgi:uncharacterized membrane protein|nr:DUF2061 domain-containing protein [uncultured Bradyrhizobium sp.]ERF82600.1 MAG: hypothetical protein C207_04218 [Bradyrhizobium sp. DFCI-1]MBR1019637.1 DUF2061 domain-containing protein [Bradyrhizobium viridifuturi]PSO24932.1 DUF2061 domain-containing protein [Bradyrhizobium sp. MOS004]QRI66998.1 DUF2061 domain-containing protein [Bradyrhizobium sp. PSBB068]HAQ81981.1 DUF2061 domain-containing protein [Bradyrhizobium sp.]